MSWQNLASKQTANRLNELNDRQSGETIRGDFTGTVEAFWVARYQDGSGRVKYNGKIYVASPVGFVSLPKGSLVELTFANGVYFANF